jgi:hypothetical protein
MNPIKKKYTDDLCDILLAEIMDCEDKKLKPEEILEWLKLWLDEEGRHLIWVK